MRRYRNRVALGFLGCQLRLFRESRPTLDHLCSSFFSSRTKKKRLDVLYEDDVMVAMNKPAGVPTQGGKGVGMSVDAMYSDYKLVHRLDKDVSGVLVMAKTAAAAKELGYYFQRDALVNKVYWAMVCGSTDSRVGGHHGVIRIPVRGKTAVTKVDMIERKDDYNLAWMALMPETGRMHQLRIHCADGLGAAILGDAKYGRTRDAPQKDILARVREKLSKEETPRAVKSWPPIFLHCRELRLPHLDTPPAIKKDKLFVKIVAPVPDHFTILWNTYGFNT